jgi:hypothetical protein
MKMRFSRTKVTSYHSLITRVCFSNKKLCMEQGRVVVHSQFLNVFRKISIVVKLQYLGRFPLHRLPIPSGDIWNMYHRWCVVSDGGSFLNNIFTWINTVPQQIMWKIWGHLIIMHQNEDIWYNKTIPDVSLVFVAVFQVWKKLSYN